MLVDEFQDGCVVHGHLCLKNSKMAVKGMAIFDV